MSKRNSVTATAQPATGARNWPMRINWPLIVGVFLVVAISILAIFGPVLAPKDPREQKLIIQIEDTWLIPPYPAFTPGYPLGSDNLGRDLFSWLLWSVRPTMILVIVVALLRLALGLMIGIGAGWSDRWAGRLFDGMISAALSVPSLIAALIVITAVGFRLGVWAFVVGLAITGWAETAQLVREQTRTVRGQQSVEAARALGASGGQILFLHILPQVMPMIWMLSAFEISNTLVTTAGLGFLGYYLGGAVFTEVDDFVYQRISGMPELGQMLATAWMVLDEPWAMVAAGTVVFIIVLAFNLVGEGLQQRLTRHLGGSRKFYTRVAGEILPWIDQRISVPVAALAQRRWARTAVVVALIVVIGGGGIWWRVQNPPVPAPPPTAVETQVPENGPNTGDTDTASTTDPGAIAAPTSSLVDPGPAWDRPDAPGGHPWPMEHHDAWSTLWTAFAGPQQATVRWTYQTEGGFVGGPAVAADGTIYVTTALGDLLAFAPDGTQLWQATLSGGALSGGPALGADGTIYATDGMGNLTAFSPDGKIVWRYHATGIANLPIRGSVTQPLPLEAAGPASTGPIIGPDGTIYFGLAVGMGNSFGNPFIRAEVMQAVSPEGVGLLDDPSFIRSEQTAPRLLLDSGIVLWGGNSMYAQGEQPLEFYFGYLEGIRDGNDRLRIGVSTGADGRAYAVYLRTLESWFLTDAGIGVSRTFTWEPETSPGSAGVAGATPDGLVWMLFRSGKFIWVDADDTVSGPVRFPLESMLVAVDVDATAYGCGSSMGKTPECMAYTMDETEPRWHITLEGGDEFVGGALAPGVLYATTQNGYLYALGDE